MWKNRPRVFILVILLYDGRQGVNSCLKKTFGEGSFVCVCSNDYCDDFPEVFVEEGHFMQIVSSKLHHRFEQFGGPLEDTPSPGSTVVSIDLKETLQTMHGFGGAFTDATGINIAQLSMPMQEKLVASYFSPSGIEYTIGRIPIAGSDFSTRPYSYDDVEGDIALEHFALTGEDHLYKLPYIAWAQDMSERPLLMFGSPWAPPAWMKETGMFNGTGGIKAEMWQPWSNYIVKFVEAYESEGVPMWGLTPQNEPVIGEEDWEWNACAWNATAMRDWIKTNLGPTLEAAGMRRLKLMVLDHNRDDLPWYPDTILADPDAYQYVDGIGVHWYRDDHTSPDLMDLMHEDFPEKFILYTEACEGSHSIPEERVLLGSWERAENYTHNIIEDVNHWATGWVDWNMALDLQGGPNWANNFVDAPILVKEDEDVFYKQPMFYAMGHFSKYVTTGDVRVFSSITPAATDGRSPRTVKQDLEVSAFRRTNGAVVVIIMNTREGEEAIAIQDSQGSVINLNLEPRSLNTVLYQP